MPLIDCSSLTEQPTAKEVKEHLKQHLKKMYEHTYISSGTKWPSTPSKEYIRLTVVKNDKKCRDQYIGFTLVKKEGNIKKRKEISIDEILQPDKENKSFRLVLMEGAPGIGKSTLSWELCRQWDEIPCLKQYSLVILLRLREEAVRNITNVNQLFSLHDQCISKDELDCLTKEVLKNYGNGILFILDGFDELPKAHQKEGFLFNLIKGTVLPDSTVLVTSRPSATGELLKTCRSSIHKHVEVLGFTQESVENYARSVFSEEPETLENFMTYISASNNPAINSLMYVPLNAAIIVRMYQENNSEEMLPHTLTELYTELCMTILNRYLDSQSLPTVMKFEELTSEFFEQFLLLSKMAFCGIEKDKVIFNEDVPKIHFGFLDSVPSLYKCGAVSCNFLHLTIQEFFAAYYITRLDSKNGCSVFQKYSNEKQWNVVWRFVAGLTKFEAYKGQIDSSVFTAPYNRLSYTTFLFQCLYEAQTPEHFYSALDASQSHSAILPSVYESEDSVSSAFEATSLRTTNAKIKKPENVFFSSSLFSNASTDENPAAVVHLSSASSTKLDAYSLGYCIANFPIGVTWNVTLEGDLHHSFTCGLRTRKQGCIGVLSGIHIHDCSQIKFSEFISNPLQLITQLSLMYCNLTGSEMLLLADIIPSLRVLKALSLHHNPLSSGPQNGLYQVLLQLCDSNVTELHIPNTGLGELLGSSYDYFSVLRRLLDPDSWKIEMLGIGHFLQYYDANNDMLAGFLSSGPFSVVGLGLFFNDLSPHVEHLKNNFWLSALGLFFDDPLPHVIYLSDILQNNNTIKFMGMFIYKEFVDIDIDSIELIVNKIHSNSSLCLVFIFIVGVGDNDEAVMDYMSMNHKNLTEIDERIVWKHNNQ